MPAACAAGAAGTAQPAPDSHALARCGKGVGAVEDKITKGKSYDPDKVTKDVCAKQFCNS